MPHRGSTTGRKTPPLFPSARNVFGRCAAVSAAQSRLSRLGTDQSTNVLQTAAIALRGVPSIYVPGLLALSPRARPSEYFDAHAFRSTNVWDSLGSPGLCHGSRLLYRTVIPPVATGGAPALFSCTTLHCNKQGSWDGDAPFLRACCRKVGAARRRFRQNGRWTRDRGGYAKALW